MFRLILISNNKEILLTNDEDLSLIDMLLSGPFVGYVADKDGNILAIKGLINSKNF